MRVLLHRLSAFASLALGAFLLWAAPALGAPSLDPATGIVGGATQLVPLANGQLIVVYPSGAGGLSLERLNADGSADTAFDASGIRIDEMDSITALPSGDLLLAGQIATDPAGASNETLLELAANGGVDPAFNAGSVYGPSPILDAKGNILLLTYTTNADGSAQPALVRLLPNGSVDPAYQPGVALLTDGDYSLLLQADGRLLVEGEDGASSGQANLARLNADGSLDASFNPPPAVAGAEGVSAIAAGADGRLLVAVYTSADDGSCTLSCLLPDGTADPAFGGTVQFDSSVDHVAFLPDGGALVSGEFSEVNGIARNGFARLLADGSVDPAFDPMSGEAGAFQGFVVASDGSMIFAFGAAPDGSLNPGVIVEREGLSDTGAQVENVPNCSWCTLTLQASGAGVYIATEVFQPNIILEFPPAGVAVPEAAPSTSSSSGISPPPGGGGGGVIVKDRPTVALKAVRSRVFSGSRSPGKFLLTRTGDVSADLTVLYSVKGTAVAGEDYLPLRGYRTIKAGRAVAMIRVKPVHDHFRLVQGGRAGVKLEIAAAAGYDVAMPGKAHVRIVNKGGGGEQ
jgi:uncharacterized delta-60 repeat protein